MLFLCIRHIYTDLDANVNVKMRLARTNGEQPNDFPGLIQRAYENMDGTEVGVG